MADSGIGIPEDELPHVTERFYRGPASPGIAAGSGIGLAIVAELTRAHGGEVQIASEPGHGTEVTVALPGRVGDERSESPVNVRHWPFSRLSAVVDANAVKAERYRSVVPDLDAGA